VSEMIEFEAFSPWLSGTTFEQTEAPHIRLSLLEHGDLLIEGRAPYKNNPTPQAPFGRLWGLWDYEVLEVFIYGDHDEYIELEFGPWGHYLALYFQGVRSLKREEVYLKNLRSWRVEGRVGYESQWGFSCILKREVLPQKIHDQSQDTWGINAFWCFNDLEGNRHFCCAHPLPGETPDFHQPKDFPKYPLEQNRPKSH
jgi:hypothetical protein